MITKEKVEKHLNHLKEAKSAGVDDLPPILLMRIAKNIVDPLTKTFQESFNSGGVPNDWRNANVTPIHKKLIKDKSIKLSHNKPHISGMSHF